jgi:PhnB protein
MQVQPYLFFNGRCEEAVEFYRTALGAQVQMLMHYKDSPEPATCPSGATDIGDMVMHASLRVGQTIVMASDDPTGASQSHQGFALSIIAADEAEADRLFAALSDGGQVHMPLAKTFFSPRFGMVADRFGVLWMVLVPREHASAR